MGRKRQLVLIAPSDLDNPSSGTRPLGSRREVERLLAEFNTAGDGAARGSVGTDVLHGPGLVVEVPQGLDELNQALVTVTDADCAWPVLSRVCKAHGWRMQDVESGQIFGG
mgnify:CR=1 FL=1